MRQVSEKDLARMKKGGVKMRRKLGTGMKKSEPETEVEEALSGATDTESAAPALPSVEVDMKPYASMAASMAASNEQMTVLIEQNSLTIAMFGEKLQDIVPQKRVPWVHDIKRSDKGLIKQVISTPRES